MMGSSTWARPTVAAAWKAAVAAAQKANQEPPELGD